jgi:hypothetical protein
MSLRSIVRPTAEAALYAAAGWYQDSAPDSSLWLELLDEFNDVVVRVCEYPESAPVYEEVTQPHVLAHSRAPVL